MALEKIYKEIESDIKNLNTDITYLAKDFIKNNANKIILKS